MAKPVKFIEGERIYLRPYEAEDAELVYRAVYEPEMRRLTGTQRLFSRSGVAGFLEKIAGDDSRADLVIALQENDQVTGEVVLNNIDFINRSANIRIGLFDPQYFSKGYGSEALLLMLGHGFNNLNLHRIELGVFDFNPRAIHVYEKLGFKREGVLRDYLFSDGAYHDQILMSILDHEYREKYGAK
jgi:RimJ/RimL family protein N-acetyltransferase